MFQAGFETSVEYLTLEPPSFVFLPRQKTKKKTTNNKQKKKNDVSFAVLHFDNVLHHSSKINVLILFS